MSNNSTTRQNKSRAGKASVNARRKIRQAAAIDQEYIDQELAKADEASGRPSSWADWEKRAKFEGQLILNASRKIEMDTAAKRLITPEQKDSELEALALAFREVIAEIAPLFVEHAPRSERPAWRAVGKKVADAVSNRVADIIRERM